MPRRPGRALIPLTPGTVGSTYRVQLQGLGFAGAAALVPYLRRLGVETLYASPILAAAPGSTHGYDVIDPGRLDPALGTTDDLERLLGTLDEHGMRLLVDIVPNHMAAVAANGWWCDVLRHGRRSRYAGVFDIDWSMHGGRVLLPVLGRPIGEVLARGELTIEHQGEESVLAYFERRFPVDPGPDADGYVSEGSGDVAALLARQHYRLAYWRLGRRQGNYRRFFDIDGLVGVRVEDPDVFTATHRRILELAADRRVAGLRVDHVDGLADPTGYLARLRTAVDGRRDAPADRAVVLVEKILARGESLPEQWPVDGTTGYEFIDIAGGLFIAPGPADRRFPRIRSEAKRLVLDTSFPGQRAALARRLCSAVEADAPGSDVDPVDAEGVLTELIVHLDVYRTYFDSAPPTPEDRARLTAAASAAAAALDGEGRRLLDDLRRGLTDEKRPSDLWREVAQRLQQLSGAVMAKGGEDTALFRTTGPAEVGADGDAPAVAPALFHRSMAGRVGHHRGTLNATSTHDTKFGEDTRARLAVLSEWAEPWAGYMEVWHDRHRRAYGSPAYPHPDDAAVVYRAAVGIWPADGRPAAELERRLAGYAVKAAREAKLRTSWLEPDDAYEDVLRRFVARLLSLDNAPFRQDMTAVMGAIGPAGAANSLAQLVLKALVPGVPDFYQGAETWLLSLVDPDNRRPVDFAAARQLREESRSVPVESLLGSWPDGRVKLAVTERLLGLRREMPDLFSQAGYVALRVTGTAADHVVAFARRWERWWCIAVVPRLTLRLVGPGGLPVGVDVWGETAVELPDEAPHQWHDVLLDRTRSCTDGAVLVAELCAHLPVAVLTSA
ncbi:MAG: malto-oligosyltrehalose synthase [Acidimicrobiales bacterium]